MAYYFVISNHVYVDMATRPPPFIFFENADSIHMITRPDGILDTIVTCVRRYGEAHVFKKDNSIVIDREPGNGECAFVTSSTTPGSNIRNALAPFAERLCGKPEKEAASILLHRLDRFDKCGLDEIIKYLQCSGPLGPYGKRTLFQSDKTLHRDNVPATDQLEWCINIIRTEVYRVRADNETRNEWTCYMEKAFPNAQIPPMIHVRLDAPMDELVDAVCDHMYRTAKVYMWEDDGKLCIDHTKPSDGTVPWRLVPEDFPGSGRRAYIRLILEQYYRRSPDMDLDNVVDDVFYDLTWRDESDVGTTLAAYGIDADCFMLYKKDMPSTGRYRWIKNEILKRVSGWHGQLDNGI